MIYKTYLKRYNNRISGKIILYSAALFGADACNRAKYILGVADKGSAIKWNKAIKEIPHHQGGGGVNDFKTYENYLTANGWKQAT